MLMKTLLMTLILSGVIYAGDGWVIYEKDSEGDISKTYTDGKRIAQVDEDSDFSSIFDISTFQVTMINSDEELYWTGTWKEFTSATTEVVDEAKKKAMESVPEAYRAQMEAMMGGGAPVGPKGKGTLVKVGPEKVGKYNTVKYLLQFDGKTVEELWVSDELPFWSIMHSYMEKMPKENWEFFTDNEFSKQLNIEFPVEYFMLFQDYYQVKKVMNIDNPMMGGSYTFSEEIDRVEQKELDEAVFTVPAGYKKANLKEFIGMGMDD